MNPRLGFGCEPLGGTDWGAVDLEQIARAINLAIDLGVTLFDTADVYGLGLSETRLARILGARISTVDISTKGGVRWRTTSNVARAETFFDATPSSLREALEGSRRRLRLETIPIYFLHWPDPGSDIRSSMDFLMYARDRGWIREIGCSNFSISDLERASSVAEIAYLQTPINPLWGPLDDELVNCIRKNSIKVMAYSVLAQGLLTGKFSDDSHFTLNDRRSRLEDFRGEKLISNLRRVKDIHASACASNMTLVEYSIRWVLSQPCVESAIVGFKSPVQLREAVAAFT